MKKTTVEISKLDNLIPIATEQNFDLLKIKEYLQNLDQCIFILKKDCNYFITNFENIIISNSYTNNKSSINSEYELLAIIPSILPRNLGDRSFTNDLGINYAYLGGSMAHGISSLQLAEELGRGGMLGFIGAGGQSIQWVEETIIKAKQSPYKFNFGVNLIHTPNEPELENKLVDLFLKHEVNLIEASAFLTITPALVRYRLSGLQKDSQGNIIAKNRIIAKVSRVEVASKFWAPPPPKIVSELLQKNLITQEQANMGCNLPIAQDITAEADSGGHTDNRPAICLMPTFLSLKERLQKQYNYSFKLRVGLGGGIGTPASVAAAFSMGAGWIMLGSIHQSCIEAGTSQKAKEMLANAGQADVAMAPAGDMFEMGVNVQVLKRGTLFAMRAKKLYELYVSYKSLDEIPASERENIEKNIFRAKLDEIWEQTKEFFNIRDPKQIERAERDPKHKMALVFRWYLGLSPKWAISGNPDRVVDYQIWCGPSMGAFNEWVKDSYLEKLENRKVIDIAANLLYNSCYILRANNLLYQIPHISTELLHTKPVDQNIWSKYIKF